MSAGLQDNDDLTSYLPGADSSAEVAFNEVSYLLANPDVAEKVVKGELPSGHFHYERHGRKEGRSLCVSERANIDAVVCTASGSVFIIGWAEEYVSNIKAVRVTTSQGTTEIPARRLVRFRRPDAEAVLSFEGVRHFGFCALACGRPGAARGLPSRRAVVMLDFENGRASRFDLEARTVEDGKLLELILAYVSSMTFCGNPHVETMFALDGGFGADVVNLNRAINRNLLKSASCVWRNESARRPRASIVVCLYGKPEFMFLQIACLFGCLRSTEYELIYVCNSPELLEILVRTATVCASVYGARQTIVGLPGNAGFGAANNVAVQYATSDRIIFMNPDVFPKQSTWIPAHENALDGLPPDQSRLFGSRLFYADGSLMHAGMFFEMDIGLSLSGDTVRRRDMFRVEHYGKGAPPSQFAGSARVPAVSGAFISIERKLFESLNGFSDEVVYGHYEDADLCLRARERGVHSWVHDIPLWHLEGKGSYRLPHHEGASSVNRWMFARNWGATLKEGWLGPKPTALHPQRARPAFDLRVEPGARRGTLVLAGAH